MSVRNERAKAVLAIALVLAVALPAAALEKLDVPLSQLVATSSAQGRICVIVQTLQPPAGREMQEVQALGAAVGEPFVSINGFPAAVPVSALDELAFRPWVSCISADLRMTPALDRAAAAVEVIGPRDGLGLTGAGVRVAVIDSGIAEHPDLPNVVVRKSFVPGGEVGDEYGHGTAVAAAIAGTGDASGILNSVRRFVGMAPGAELIDLKVIDRNGSCPTSRVIRALDWCLANQESESIRIACIALTHPVAEGYRTDPLTQACERLWQNGILVVAAAGNGGPSRGSVHSPGNDPYVLTVGAADALGAAMSDFSGVGPSHVDLVRKPDVLAPGAGLVVALSPNRRADSPAHGATALPPSAYVVGPARPGVTRYETARGTSLSAGIVAGVAALMLEAEPSLSPDTVKLRIVSTARPIGDIANATLGIASAALALSADLQADCPALSPEAQEGDSELAANPDDATTNLIWDPQDGDDDEDPAAGDNPPPDDGATTDPPDGGTDPPPDDGGTTDPPDGGTDPPPDDPPPDEPPPDEPPA